MTKETAAVKKQRIAALEANPESWFKYYLPMYYTHEPADFHRESTNRVLSNTHWTEVRIWCRDMGKETRAMMETLYLMLVKKKNRVLIAADTARNANIIVNKYKAQLTGNRRFIDDYAESAFNIIGIGVGQLPCGTTNNNPDIILVHSIDTSDNCSSIVEIERRWQWVNKALYNVWPPVKMIWSGLLEAENCCICRIAKRADHSTTVNIRNSQGKSTWPQRNSQQEIDKILQLISYKAAQREFFNNPDA